MSKFNTRRVENIRSYNKLPPLKERIRKVGNYITPDSNIIYLSFSFFLLTIDGEKITISILYYIFVLKMPFFLACLVQIYKASL